MWDETLVDQPDIELDALIAEQMFHEGDRYAREVQRLVDFIARFAPIMRGHLLQASMIQHIRHTNREAFDLAAVDGASAAPAHGAGALIAAAAYKVTLNAEEQRGVMHSLQIRNTEDASTLATLLRTHLELALLAADKLDQDRLIILDHSFWGVLQQISRALAAYKSYYHTIRAGNQNPDLDHTIQAWQEIFDMCLGSGGSFLAMARNKQVISLSKTGVSQYFTHLLSADLSEESDRILASALNDRALLKHVLRPGEYTMPKTIYEVVQASGEIQSWHESRYATQFTGDDGPDPFTTRHQLFEEYGLPTDSRIGLVGKRLFVTYYRPHSYSRAYRVEFHERLLADLGAPRVFDYTGQGGRFQKVLASIFQSTNPEMQEPYCQVLADMRAKAAVSTAVDILPERAFYQLRERYRDAPQMQDILDTLVAEERTQVK